MGQERAVPVLYFYFVSSGPHLHLFLVYLWVLWEIASTLNFRVFLSSILIHSMNEICKACYDTDVVSKLIQRTPYATE